MSRPLLSSTREELATERQSLQDAHWELLAEHTRLRAHGHDREGHRLLTTQLHAHRERLHAFMAAVRQVRPKSR